MGAESVVESGVFIISEATLSFLGIGLPSSVVSWGADIAAAKDALNSHPSVLLFPAGALTPPSPSRWQTT